MYYFVKYLLSHFQSVRYLLERYGANIKDRDRIKHKREKERETERDGKNKTASRGSDLNCLIKSHILHVMFILQSFV